LAAPRRKERKLNQLSGQEAVLVDGNQNLAIALGKHDRRSG
jgi:hypothetical protein